MKVKTKVKDTDMIEKRKNSCRKRKRFKTSVITW